jgi:hypothetical protein
VLKSYLGGPLGVTKKTAESGSAPRGAAAPLIASPPALRPGIPRIIHQTCADGAMTDAFRANIARLKALNPGWEHRFYSDDDVQRVFEEMFTPAARDLLSRLDPAYRVVWADLFRYAVLLRDGGVYLDIKSTATRPFDEILRPDDHFVLSQWPDDPAHPYCRYGDHLELRYIDGGEFIQWALIAAPGHAFLAAALSRGFQNMANYDRWRDGRGWLGVLRLSGPICFSHAVAGQLRSAPYRLTDYWDLGLRYSIFATDTPNEAHRVKGRHYSFQRRPIMRCGWQPASFLRALGGKLSGRPYGPPIRQRSLPHRTQP